MTQLYIGMLCLYSARKKNLYMNFSLNIRFVGQMGIRVTTDMDIEATMISKYGIVHVIVKCIDFCFTFSKCINIASDLNLFHSQVLMFFIMGVPVVNFFRSSHCITRHVFRCISK